VGSPDRRGRGYRCGILFFWFHLLQVLMLSFLISLVPVAIADIDRPYEGAVKVEPEGFRYAVSTLGKAASK
jgi:hypothetical protein